jgi:hypothetical protein
MARLLTERLIEQHFTAVKGLRALDLGRVFRGSCATSWKFWRSRNCEHEALTDGVTEAFPNGQISYKGSA